jgi:hypothetical protein
MKSQWMLAALVGLALAMPARADETRAATMADLTASYNVQQSEVQGLRDKGWSWNDIGTGLAISKRTGQPLQELVAQRDSGMSWSRISEKNGFRLGEVNREAKQLARDFKRVDRESKRRDAIQGAGQGSEAAQDRDRVPAQDTDPNAPRDPSSHGPAYPQSPEGPGTDAGEPATP